jgi:hypothetical protein
VLDPTFEIANIITPEEYRGKGWFKQYLRLLGELDKRVVPIPNFIVIESVQNPDLIKHLNSSGWLTVTETPNTFSMSRLKICKVYRDISI